MNVVNFAKKHVAYHHFYGDKCGEAHGSERERPPANRCFVCAERLEVGEAVVFIVWETRDAPSGGSMLPAGASLDISPAHLSCAQEPSR